MTTRRSRSWRRLVIYATGGGDDVALAAHDIAQHVMAERGLNTSDKRLVRLAGKRVGACLRHQRDKGAVRSEQGPSRFVTWCLED